MNPKRNATILIGLDGAAFSVLDALVLEGKMPFLGAFMASGVRAELASTVPPTTPPAWTSLITGRSPGHHGILDFFRPERPGSPNLRLVNSRQIRCETIGSLLTRHGLSSIHLNFPVMSPPLPVTGYSVSGFVPWKYLRQACHPPALMDALKRIPGFNLRAMGHDFKMEEKGIVGCSREEAGDWIRHHTRKDEQWSSVARHLMTTDPCHLTAVVFDSPDRLQHAFWRLMDPSCRPERMSEDETQIVQEIAEHFRKLDRMMADIVSMAEPDADVFIVSDHGFGPSHEWFLLNTWLAERGYVRWSRDAVRQADGNADLSMDAVKRHGHLLDYAGSTAYVLTPSSNGIRVRVADTAEGPGVRPEAYEGFVSRLCDELRTIRHPQDGFPIVERVWTRGEIFNGSPLAPDLTLRLWDNGLVSTLQADTFLKKRPECTGVHHPRGVFLARGPRIRPGVTVDTLSILDVAPALLYRMGLPIPEDYEGRVPVEIFRPEVLETEPVRVGGRGAAVAYAAQRAYEPEEEEEAEIMKRLQELGYLE